MSPAINWQVASAQVRDAKLSAQSPRSFRWRRRY